MEVSDTGLSFFPIACIRVYWRAARFWGTTRLIRLIVLRNHYSLRLQLALVLIKHIYCCRIFIVIFWELSPVCKPDPVLLLKNCISQLLLHQKGLLGCKHLLLAINQLLDRNRLTSKLIPLLRRRLLYFCILSVQPKWIRISNIKRKFQSHLRSREPLCLGRVERKLPWLVTFERIKPFWLHLHLGLDHSFAFALLHLANWIGLVILDIVL